MLTRKLRRGIALSLVLVFVVMTAIALYGDVPRMIIALVHFHWQYLSVILGSILFNYGCRFGKWHYYLHHLKIDIGPGKSLLIVLGEGQKLSYARNA